MLRRKQAFLLLFSALTGCQRSDRAAPVEYMVNPATPTNVGGASAPRGAPQPAPACLVPLPEAPPASARAARECPKDPAPLPPYKRGTVKFLGGANPTIEVEMALSNEEQQHGLMYRTELAPQNGMLFSWSNETIHTFWMHNTCIPLDMLFITADGTIAGILEQVPVLNDEPRSIPCPTAHVLEVNAGYCRQHGIVPGQRVRIRES